MVGADAPTGNTTPLLKKKQFVNDTVAALENTAPPCQRSNEECYKWRTNRQAGNTIRESHGVERHIRIGISYQGRKHEPQRRRQFVP